MKNDKEDIFKKLIQKAGPDEIEGDFTSFVMNSIEMEAELDFARESIFKVLIADIKPENAPLLFQKSVMAQINPAEKTETEPIINRKVWYMIAAAAFVILTVCFVSQPDSSGKDVPYFFANINIAVSAITGKVGVLPVIYPAVVFALGLLVMGDYFLRLNLVRS